jgi:xanthine dehydrogenase small subunit
MATLLDYLRLEERACGTKEGCGEGECGACTVALGSLRGGRVVYEPVNSCIQLLGMMDGKEVVAVDDLHVREGGLHPVQRAMVATHGSQCASAGFVMSLFALYHADGAPDRAQVNDAIAGNLCRCTGYRPITEAGLKACAGTANDSYAAAAAKTSKSLCRLSDGKDVLIGNDKSFFAAPASAESLAKLYAAHPDAVLVAGATDVGLWIRQQLRSLPIIHLGRAADGWNRRQWRLVTIAAAVTTGGAGAAAASTPISASCCGAWARSRCGPPAPSAATSPTARPSATRRRR